MILGLNLGLTQNTTHIQSNRNLVDDSYHLETNGVDSQAWPHTYIPERGPCLTIHPVVARRDI